MAVSSFNVNSYTANSPPVYTVHEISNGFLLVHMREGMFPMVVYCASAVGIGETIIAQAAIAKLEGEKKERAADAENTASGMQAMLQSSTSSMSAEYSRMLAKKMADALDTSIYNNIANKYYNPPSMMGTIKDANMAELKPGMVRVKE